MFEWHPLVSLVADRACTKMPKRKAQSDWRESLFFWRGELISKEDTSNQLTWKGTWVSSVSTAPEDTEYTSSKNTFISTLSLDSEVKGITLASLTSAALTGSINSKYLLDQGDGNGLQEYEDIKQTFATFATGDRVFMTALGSTEFGSFVSCGTLTEKEDGALTLLLARRYIDDELDSRSLLVDASKVQASCLELGLEKGLLAALPFKLSKASKKGGGVGKMTK